MGKSKILTVFYLISLALISSCSLHEEKTDVFISNDPLLVTVIPRAFEYENDFYEKNDDKEEHDKEKIGDFQGYWVNQEDLEKWKQIDNDEKIKYIVNDDNSLLNFMQEEDMKNRFKFVSVK